MNHTGILSSVWPFGFLRDKYRLSFSFSFQKQRLWGEVSLYQLLACSGCGQALSLWGILFFFSSVQSNQSSINHQSHSSDFNIALGVCVLLDHCFLLSFIAWHSFFAEH